MNDFQNLIVTTLDKTNGHVVVICQQFHALVLIKELGLDCNDTDTSKSCIPGHKTNNQVISGHTTFLKLPW